MTPAETKTAPASLVEVVSPFPPESLPRAWGWLQSFKGRMTDDYSPQTLDEWVERSLVDMTRMTTWGVYRDGELGGLVSFEPWTPVLGACHCLFKRELWGHRTTLPALRRIATQIFDSGIQKIACCVFSDNQGILALLRELGGVEEGRYRRHTMRQGKLVDMTPVAIFKEAFEHACASDSSRNRRDSIDRGRGPGGPVQDANVNGHAHLVSGDEGAPGPPEQLQHVADGQPVGGTGPDPGSGHRPDQPPVLATAGPDRPQSGG